MSIQTDKHYTPMYFISMVGSTTNKPKKSMSEYIQRKIKSPFAIDKMIYSVPKYVNCMFNLKYMF